jgi:hypothetical protein
MDGLLNTLNLVHKMGVDIIKFVVVVQKWLVRYGGCSGAEVVREIWRL